MILIKWKAVYNVSYSDIDARIQNKYSFLFKKLISPE
jgi:hypothetical protein